MRSYLHWMESESLWKEACSSSVTLQAHCGAASAGQRNPVGCVPIPSSCICGQALPGVEGSCGQRAGLGGGAWGRRYRCHPTGQGAELQVARPRACSLVPTLYLQNQTEDQVIKNFKVVPRGKVAPAKVRPPAEDPGTGAMTSPSGRLSSAGPVASGTELPMILFPWEKNHRNKMTDFLMPLWNK